MYIIDKMILQIRIITDVNPYISNATCVTANRQGSAKDIVGFLVDKPYLVIILSLTGG